MRAPTIFGTLRARLLITLFLALAPVLALASVNALLIASSSNDDRRRRLVLSADYAVRDVETALSTAETLLKLFQADIERGECKRVYDDIHGLIPPLTNVARFDVDGIALCSAIGEPGYEINRLSWYDALQRGATTYRTESFFGIVSEDWLFGILSRSDTPDGKFDGVVSLGMRADGLAALIDRSALPDDVEVAIVSSTGRVYGSERFESLPEDWVAQAADISSSNLHLFKHDDDRTIDLTIRTVASTGVYVVISGPAPGLWSDIMLRPAATIGLPLLAFGIALAAVWMGIDRLVLQWLARLERVARVYGAGRYTVDATSDFGKAPDEVAGLAAAMDLMARNIAQRDDDLRSALAFRDTAVKEIHHRIKNNLQIVTSFLSLQARQLKDESGREVLASAQNRINALAIVHQTLYQTDRMTDVDLPDFLRMLMEHLSEALGLADDGIVLEQEYEPVKRPADDAIPIALFLVEAVTNAAKYAFAPGGGTIRTSLSHSDEKIVICVADNGRGFDPEAAPTGDGLGSRLMKSFARQLGAEFEVKPAEMGGTLCCLNLPLISRHQT